MKQSDQNEGPRKLSLAEKLGALVSFSMVSFLFAYFLLGSVEGIRSKDSFRIYYDSTSQEARGGLFDDNLVVEVTSARASRVSPSEEVVIRIEKQRSWFSYTVALIGGTFLFLMLWKSKLSRPEPAPWDPDLKG